MGRPRSSSLIEFSTTSDKEAQRKRTHLKSEHKRRANIQTGFDRLKQELPQEILKVKISKGEILVESIKLLEYLEERAKPFLTNNMDSLFVS